MRHRGEAELASQADTFPRTLLSGDEKGKMLAHETQTCKVSDIRNGNVLKDVDEQFIWQIGDGAWRWRGVFDFRGRWLDLQG
jgi:hypothetical protein